MGYFAMKKRIVASLIVTAAIGGVSFAQTPSAQDITFWGPYVGANIGGVWNRTCANWTPYASGFVVPDWVYSKCPDNNAFTGGVTLGYNIVGGGALFGIEADYNGWSSTS